MFLDLLWLTFTLGLFKVVAEQTPIRPDLDNETQTHRVAIIGAGAAGSSAAYHLFRFAESAKLTHSVNVTIFETNDRVGGRTTTVNALNDPRYPTELGASIFVEVNQILYNATRDFGLNSKQNIYESTGSSLDLGIWDGDSFVFTIANGGDNGGALQDRLKDIWDIGKLLWRYGLSVIRAQQLAKTTVGRFLKFYDEYFPFVDLNTAVSYADLGEFTGVTGEELLLSSGISTRFGREIIQSSTRVNYAQNLGTIHGLETMVCMSINGATAVEGGNWQIFDNMIQKSGAQLRLNSTVTGVQTTSSERSQLYIEEQAGAITEEFDTVILAAPFRDSKVRFEPGLVWEPDEVEYVDLYVTLFTSPYRPSPAYFGVHSEAEVPDSILTTLPEGTNLEKKRGSDAVGVTKFWSLSTLRVLNPSTDGFVGPHTSRERVDPELAGLGRQYLYKIFSPKPITAAWLSEIFGWEGSSPMKGSIATLPKEWVTWHHEKKWHSYPYLPPRTEFTCFRLWQQEKGNRSRPDLKSKVWYTSSIEPFISTMETSALSGMNLARMIIDELNPEVQNDPFPCVNGWRNSQTQNPKSGRSKATEL